MPGTAAPALLAGGNSAVDQRAGKKRPRRVVNENKRRRAAGQRFETGAHRGLARCAAENRRREVFQPGGRGTINVGIGRRDDRLHHADPIVAEERAQRRTDHRLAADGAILLRHVAAGALAASGCNNDRGHHARHESVSGSLSWIGFLQVPGSL